MAATTIITTEYSAAMELHGKIMANAEIAAGALLEMCSALKEMRDKELYKQLSMETFDEYCETKVGIKARQAYTYISTYERLGTTVLQSNAKLGITKLELIAQLPAVERVEGLEAGEFDGMSAKELKELVKKSKDQGEQLSLLQAKLEETENNYETEVEELRAAAEEKERLQTELEAMKSAPVEVAVQEPSKEQIEKMRTEIREELKKENKQAEESAISEEEINARIESAIKEAKAKAKQDAADKEKKLKEKQNQAQEQLTKAEERIAGLQKQLETADPEKAATVIYFKTLQDDFNRLLHSINQMKDGEQQSKFKAAVNKALGAFAANLDA